MSFANRFHVSFAWLMFILGIMLTQIMYSPSGHAGIVLSVDQPKMGIGPDTLFYPDPDGLLSIDELRALPKGAWSILGDRESIASSFEPVWLRFQVTSSLPKEELYLINSNLLPDSTEFWMFDRDGGLLQRERIANGQSTQSSWFQGVHGFEFRVTKNATVDIFLRVSSKRPTTRSFTVSTPGRYMLDQVSSELLSNIYYGTMACISLMCLFFYARIRRRIYLVYGLFALLSALNMSIGYAYWDTLRAYFGLRDYVPSASHLLNLSIFSAQIVGVAFYCEYFETKNRFPLMHKWIEGLVGILVLSLLMSLSESAASFGSKLQSLSVFLLMSAPLALSVLSIRRWNTNSAKIFLYGWSIYYVSILYWFASQIGWIPKSFWTMNAVRIGQTAEVAIVMFALVEELRGHERLKQKARESEKGQLLFRSLTHDLATPLSVILSSLRHLAKDRNLVESVPLEKIKKAATAMHETISALSLMKAIEDQKLKVELRETPIVPLIRSAIDLHLTQALEKNVEIIAEFEDGVEDVLVNLEPNVFKVQVLGNLISNAIKFSQPSSQVIVKVASEVDWVDIQVKDTGIGIPSSLLADIFSVDKPTSRAGTAGEKGTGYGMPIVKAFVESLAGKIEIESRCRDESLQPGTTISLRFMLSTSLHPDMFKSA